MATSLRRARPGRRRRRAGSAGARPPIAAGALRSGASTPERPGIHRRHARLQPFRRRLCAPRVSLASLADLNSRLPAPLPMNRFRPNLVLDGVEPYGEDAIHELRAGRLALRLVKPCTRCTIPTTDQRRGARSRGAAAHAARYRWDEQLRGVTFGQNAIVVAGAGGGLRSGRKFRQCCAAEDGEPVWRVSTDAGKRYIGSAGRRSSRGSRD